MRCFDLEPHEFVIRHVRKHWLLFVAQLLPFGILAVLPFALPTVLSLIPNGSAYLGYVNYTEPIARGLLGLWLLVVWTSAWGVFTRYYLSQWVLTNERIVNVKQKRFFYREVSSLFLSRVQDVTSDVEGVLESVVNMGDIKVQSAGEEVQFVMRNIPHPDHLRDLILKYVPEEEKKEPGV